MKKLGIMKELVNKYFTNNISSSELIALSNLLKKSKNRKYFEEYTRLDHGFNFALRKVDLEAEYLKIEQKIMSQEKPRKLRTTNWYQWAAVFVGLVGLGYFYTTYNSQNEILEIDENLIILTLDNGDIKVISEDGTGEIITKEGQVIVTQKSGNLNYESGDSINKSVEEKLVFNELAIPYGKKLQITLSDGTLVYLNAGSTLKYPVKFLPGMERQVFLNGEAFFEVAKDTKNLFVVNTSEVNIQVYGTKFNVNAYKEDQEINTVLVEGSVGIYSPNEKGSNNIVLLTPNHMASWNKKEQQLRKNEVVDVNEYTAWTRGQMIFKVRPFSEIIKVLERHYDVAITNNYKHLNNQRFFAKFDIETIDQVLESFQGSEPFVFKKEGNKIIITNLLNE
jgi:transmembrane sensor